MTSKIILLVVGVLLASHANCIPAGGVGIPSPTATMILKLVQMSNDAGLRFGNVTETLKNQIALAKSQAELQLQQLSTISAGKSDACQSEVLNANTASESLLAQLDLCGQLEVNQAAEQLTQLKVAKGQIRLAGPSCKGQIALGVDYNSCVEDKMNAIEDSANGFVDNIDDSLNDIMGSTCVSDIESQVADVIADATANVQECA